LDIDKKLHNYLKITGILYNVFRPLAYPGIFFRGVQQIRLRTEDRENGELGVVTP